MASVKGNLTCRLCSGWSYAPKYRLKPSGRWLTGRESWKELPPTREEEVLKREAQRVMRAIALTTDHRRLSSLVGSFEKYALLSTRFRASSMHNALAKKLKGGWAIVKPRLESLLFAQSFEHGLEEEENLLWDSLAQGQRTKSLGETLRCRRLPCVDEMTQMVSWVAALRPPPRVSKRRLSSSCLAGHASSLDAYRAIHPLVQAIGFGGCRTQLDVFNLTGTAERREVKEALACSTSTLLSSPREILEVVAKAELVAANVATGCSPSARLSLSKRLRASCVQACSHSVAISQIDGLIDDLERRGTLGGPLEAFAGFVLGCADEDFDESLCESCRLAKMSATSRAFAAAERCHAEWAEIERTGVNHLLQLRKRFSSYKLRWLEEARIASDRIGQPPPDEGLLTFDTPPLHAKKASRTKIIDDWVGRQPRRTNISEGSLAHAGVSVKSGFDTSRNLACSVFVENLPADATEDDVRTALEGCGNIASVTVYTRRIDVKPACPAASGGSRSYKLRTVPSTGGDISSTTAIVDFVDIEAAAKATSRSLRVFGVIIKRRPCRTRPAATVKSFFLHHLNTSLSDEKVLKAKLDQIFDGRTDPIHIWHEDFFTPPDRLRLRFQNHHAAQWAWVRLQSYVKETSSSDSPLFELSWSENSPKVRKPRRDATQYCVRQLNQHTAELDQDVGEKLLLS